MSVSTGLRGLITHACVRASQARASSRVVRSVTMQRLIRVQSLIIASRRPRATHSSSQSNLSLSLSLSLWFIPRAWNDAATRHNKANFTLTTVRPTTDRNTYNEVIMVCDRRCGRSMLLRTDITGRSRHIETEMRYPHARPYALVHSPSMMTDDESDRVETGESKRCSRSCYEDCHHDRVMTADDARKLTWLVAGCWCG